MRREREKIGNLFQLFLNEFQDDFENEEAAMEVFTNLYNEGRLENLTSDTPTEQAYSLLDEAMQTFDQKQQQELLDQAKKLAPDNLDILSQSILFENDLHQAYEKLEELERSYFKQHRKDISEGYLLFENRPYFRLKADLVEYYYNQFLFGKAEAHARASLRYNPNDNLGVRYNLMATYLSTFNIKKARQLFKQYGQDDDIFLLYIATGNILNGSLADAKKQIKQLYEINPNITKFFEEIEFDPETFLDLDQVPYAFTLNSYESLVTGFINIFHLFASSDYLYQTFRNNLKELAPKNSAFSRSDLINIRQGLLTDAMQSKGIFKNIKRQYVLPLIQAGLESKEDFAKVTQAEVLAIDGIGKKTIEHLLENGVEFAD